jgi:hypothetical protein
MYRTQLAPLRPQRTHLSLLRFLAGHLWEPELILFLLVLLPFLPLAANYVCRHFVRMYRHLCLCTHKFIFLPLAANYVCTHFVRMYRHLCLCTHKFMYVCMYMLCPCLYICKYVYVFIGMLCAVLAEFDKSTALLSRFSLSCRKIQLLYKFYTHYTFLKLGLWHKNKNHSYIKKNKCN